MEILLTFRVLLQSCNLPEVLPDFLPQCPASMSDSLPPHHVTFVCRSPRSEAAWPLGLGRLPPELGEAASVPGEPPVHLL